MIVGFTLIWDHMHSRKKMANSSHSPFRPSKGPCKAQPLLTYPGCEGSTRSMFPIMRVVVLIVDIHSCECYHDFKE